MESVELAVLAKELRGLKSAVLSSHVSPDPDAVGSCFALAHLLQNMGMRVAVCLSDPIPSKLEPFLGGIPQVQPPFAETYDAAIVVDTATRKRVGAVVEPFLAQPKTFNIDHHQSNDLWAGTNHIDIKAPAAAVIIWKLAKELGAELTPTVANLLYAGLVDDTGGFCFSSASAEAFQCGAELVSAGARPNDIANALYFSTPLRVLKLQALALANLRVLGEGKVSLLTITQEELEECGANAEDTEGLVDIARKVEGAEVAIFLRQLADGWKFSLRSKTTFDVNAIAGKFGGGGHVAAAGGKVLGNQAEAERALLAEVLQVLQAKN